STGAQRAANNADIVAYPSDNYAGLSTQLGAYGGDNEAGQVWPNGNDDPEFACVTPLIVNYSSTAFSGADNTFRSKGEEAMRYAVTKSYRTALGGRQMNLFLLSNDLYYQFKMSQAGKERLIVSSNTGLRALGFDDVIHLDGIEVTYENSINSRWGYGINADNIELRNIYDSIVKAKAEDFKYNHVTQRVEAAVVNLGNLCFRSPRNTVKLMPYTDM
ncbi:MAG: hypothetical protein NNA30_11525, partial [Nitrospira sp.]|nr:hypothetical protein [Nitrospira sp.]